MISNFKADLTYGQLGESFVQHLGKDISIEVKRDRKWNVTGNIFIEVSCNDKPSGVTNTEAEYLVYLLSKNSVQVGAYLLNVEALRKVLPQMVKDKHAIEKNWSGDGGRVRGIVISIDKIGELLRRMECTIV